MKHLIFLLSVFFTSCSTTQVVVLDGDVIHEKKILRLTNEIDTLRYITLWNGDIITVEEFNKRWDKSVSNTTKKIKKKIKQGD